MTRQVEREREDMGRAIAGTTVCDLLERNATRHPDRPAFSFKEDGAWRTETWSWYRDRVREAALGLDALGVGPGDVVAIMGTTRWEHLVADQGAAHVGGTPSTFYRTLAPEQIQYVAGNCRAKVAILENRDYLKRFMEVRAELPHLEHIVLMEHAEDFAADEAVSSFQELLDRGGQADAERFDEMWQAIEPDDVATLIYTSGTTGRPKGVPLTHANVLFQAEATDRVIQLPDFATSVAYLPLAHIAERMLSIYLPLKTTGHVYFCPEPDQALDYLLEARPSTFFGVPRVWEKVKAGITANIESEESDLKRRLAEQAIKIGTAVTRLEQEGKRPSLFLRAEHALLDKLVLSTIRENVGLDNSEFTSSAAAPLPYDVAEFFAAIGLPLLEVYGMTETTGVATANRPNTLKIGTVGQALPGVEVTLADEDDEVLIRGPVNTPGYLNLPDETEALMDDDGWLYTGDIGEMDAEGYLKIVDRKKELIVTSSGKNLSPVHIESLLKQHPLVGQALAYGDDRPYIVALIVLDAEVAPGWADQHGIDADDLADLAEHPDVVAEVQRAVDEANDKLARIEQVKTFTVLPTEWSAETEELTPTMKLKRRVVHDKYADEIQELYESSK